MLFFQQAGTATAHENTIIIDTDMGLDDARAIFALLAADNINIHGFITVEGSAAVGAGTDNLAGLIESLGGEGMAILRGSPRTDLEAPPWRETANELGGGVFPPPRRAAVRPAAPEALAELLADEHERIDYLALGPLANLASFVREHGNALAGRIVVWIPAAFDPDGALKGWNLAWDIASTGTVFREAPEIVIVDLAGAESIDAAGVLSSVGEESPAGRWISRTGSAEGDMRQHVFFNDELAAAALIDPELVKLGEQRYRATVDTSGVIALRAHRDGNIRIARLQDTEPCVDLLMSLWKKEEHTHGSSLGGAADESIPVERLIKYFHGHLGPYVVLGYRMGRTALEITGSTGHFGISAEVHSILEPPPSCLIDGVQLGSGCTLGKRNITLHETTGPAFAVFTASGGSSMRVALKPHLPDLIARLIDEHGVEAAGREILGMAASELFDIKTTGPAETR